jgi:hypothetical protein
MCKEMPVIPANMVVDTKRIIGIMEGRGEEEANRGTAPPPPPQKKIKIIL